MKTTEPEGRSRTRTGAVLIALGAVGAGMLILVILALRSHAQLGADRDVFDTVDALFTAVTARDEKRLGECEQRLRRYREAGRLPSDAADELDAIIRKAKSGSWQTAAERLYAFMRAQRREGPHGRPQQGRRR